ncbi:MAG: PEGA domain-containing protein, partial [Candidatus Saccharibacteria bacterium]
IEGEDLSLAGWSKKYKFAKLIAVYALMTLSTFAIVIFIILFIMGFRLEKGQIEQYAFMQFNSSPAGATVTVDGKIINGQTPNKASMPEGSYEIVMWRSGYETWRKTVDIKSGELTWLNYAWMIPTKLALEPVASYNTLFMTSASPAGKYMLAQKSADMPIFDLVDLSADTTKTTQVTIAPNAYSESSSYGVVHSFRVEQWDNGERYILVQHTYNDKTELLVVDTQGTSPTKNITKLFNLAFTNVKFSSNGGNILYALEAGNIRKLDIGAETISKALAIGVSDFELYDSNIITYVGAGDTGKRVVGLYRDGDESPYILKTIDSDGSVPLHAVSTHYFNEDYIAIAEGKAVQVYKGNYRNAIVGDTSSIKLIKSFDASDVVQNLSFSPSGQYLLAQSGANFTSYDMEYQKVSSSTVDNTGTTLPPRWINTSYLWSDSSSNLSIREFDGANVHSINPVVTGQSATLTKNGRYLYSVGKTDAGYQLQRVSMLAP